jgi:expansin (peptidoglycan-binding protein)
MRASPVAAALLALALAGTAGPPARAATGDEIGCSGRIAWTGVTATFYDAITTNACSLPVAPGDLTAAVAEADFDGSAVCGRCARVTGPLGSVVVRITDYCPASSVCTAGHLDLSSAAFAAIANPIDGIAPISWETVACDDAGAIQFFFETSSNSYYGDLQLRNHRYGVGAVAVRVGTGWVDLPRQLDDHFVLGSPDVPTPFVPPFDFRVTDVHGDVVEADGIPFTTGVELDSGVQMPTCPEPGGTAGAAAAGLALVRHRRRPRPQPR